MASTPKSLRGLIPFFKPYRVALGFAALFLFLAAGTTLAFPWVLRQLIDQGLASGATADQLSGNFLQLFGVAVALAVFSAGRYYTVSWLGERITADLRNAVYGHVLKQSPAFFETTQSGEVLSRLTNDTTLVQTVVGSSFSMGLRNLVMGSGALLMLVWTNPVLMLQVVAVLVAAGAEVAKGTPLLVMEAMKMEHTIAAPADGRVQALLYAVGDQVDEGGELLRLAPV